VNRAEFLVRSAAVVFGLSAGPRYRSRPDLSPPPVAILHPASGVAPGYLFLAPSSGPGQHGPLILDDAGNVVWFRPVTPRTAMNFRAQTFRGEPVLTWWESLPGGGLGRGEHVIVDASYREIARFPAGDGMRADEHEFLLTTQGTALVTSLEVRRRGKRGLTLGGVVQELDVPSAHVLFEWKSLDHVGVDETYSTKVGYPWDYFHVNSIDVDSDDNLLVSARNTWTVYKVNRRTGAVMWRLGGKRSDFELGKGARFGWQHDARAHDDGRAISVFDNGVGPHSRGLVLELGGERANVLREYVHAPPLHAYKLGSVQLLGDGDVLVGWGTDPHFTEFSASGAVKLDATLPHGAENYRALRFPWVGRPTDSPRAVVRSGAVYASWNGATEVAAWRIEPGGTAVRRTGFETVLPLRSGRVVALDAQGRALGSYRLS
jgi:Arylsulfotransferase (ASST)